MSVSIRLLGSLVVARSSHRDLFMRRLPLVLMILWLLDPSDRAAAADSADTIDIAHLRMIARGVSDLTATPRPCTPPRGSSRARRYALDGTRLDRGLWSRWIDIDGDGQCEMLAQTCTVTSAKGLDHDCDRPWVAALKWDGTAWRERSDTYGGAASNYLHDSIDFRYFDRRIGKLRLEISHRGRVIPSVWIEYLPSNGDATPRGEFGYDDEKRPDQSAGALLPLIAMHVRRIHAEYRWRIDHCGGASSHSTIWRGSPQGFFPARSSCARERPRYRPMRVSWGICLGRTWKRSDASFRTAARSMAATGISRRRNRDGDARASFVRCVVAGACRSLHEALAGRVWRALDVRIARECLGRAYASGGEFGLASSAESARLSLDGRPDISPGERW